MLSFLLTLSAHAADLPPQLLAWDPVILAALEPGFTMEGTPLAYVSRTQELAASPIAQLLEEPLPQQGDARWMLALGAASVAPRTSLQQAWVPVDDPAAANIEVRARLEALAWTPSPLDCGADCTLWVNPEKRSWLPSQLAVLTPPDALRLVAALSADGEMSAADWRATLEATGALPKTPAVASLLAPETKNGALLRTVMLPDWSLREGTLLAEQAVRGSSSESRWTLWWAAAGINHSAVTRMDPQALEAEDLLLRETDAGWQAVTTLTEHGARLRQHRRPGRLPTWTGPEPALELSFAGDVAARLEASLRLNLDPATPTSMLRLGEICGPSCPAMLVSSPWAYLATLLGSLPEGRGPGRLEIVALRVVALPGPASPPPTGLALQLSSRAAAAAMEQKLRDFMAENPPPRPEWAFSLVREGQVLLLGIGLDAAEHFGEAEWVAPGVTAHVVPEQLLPTNLRMQLPTRDLPGPFDVRTRIQGGALILDRGDGPPAASAAFTPATPAPQVCTAELAALGRYGDALAHAAPEQVEAIRPTLEAEVLPGLERCAAAHPDDPRTASALAHARLGVGVHHLTDGDLLQARPAFEAACAEDIVGGCFGLTLLPETAPEAEALPRSEAGLPRSVRWFSVVEDRVYLPGGGSCGLTEAACLAAATSFEPVGVSIAADRDVADLQVLVAQIPRGEWGSGLTLAVQGATGVQGVRVRLAPQEDPTHAPELVQVTLDGGTLRVADVVTSPETLTEALDAACHEALSGAVRLIPEAATVQELIDAWILLELQARPSQHIALELPLRSR
ncbi:MAG: hypothetical protein H6739_35675 [Alphaproteobacteria bacterium]|nr:hypothetical protein [Alphaproteobacteria bacterium]